MKLTVFQTGKKFILLNEIQHLLHSFHIILAWILSVKKAVISIYNAKNVEYLCQDLIDIALKAGRYAE